MPVAFLTAEQCYPSGSFLQLLKVRVEQNKIVGIPYQERFFDRVAFRAFIAKLIRRASQ